ncbi:MAG: hypothetical protein RR643_05205 [Anaerorhabdus sp.]|uniref:hypothetical protein n=1 Tax=Anaerorhabdus sp. TaxID=1872524 RepID=UPI002FC61B8E
MGLKIHNRPRGSGKTQECIDRMKSDEKLLMLVTTHKQKEYYPKELHDRIIVAKNIGDTLNHIQTHNPTKIQPGGFMLKKLLIDEGFLGMSRTDIANFYYELGEIYSDVEMYCTDSQEKHTL